jgi:hypothetical protein
MAAQLSDAFALMRELDFGKAKPLALIARYSEDSLVKLVCRTFHQPLCEP